MNRNGWKVTRLGDLISLKGGLSYKGELVGSGDALLLGMGAVSNTQRFLESGARKYSGSYTSAHLASPGDLVIATRQQSDNLPILGFPAMIPDSWSGKVVIVGTNLYKIFNDSEVDNRFLYWLLKSPAYKARILSCSKGTTVRMLTKDSVEDYVFELPPLEERNRISNILDNLDRKMELNRRMAAMLEEMARALFKSWFVDFDPVRAKAEGRPTGLPPDIDALFPDELVESELGLIPKGWKVSTLAQLVDLNPTRSLKKGQVAKYLDMANVRTAGPSVDEVVEREFGSGTKLMNGDTLLARITPCLENGKTAFVDFLEEGEVGWGSTEFVVMKPRAPLPDEFAYCLARDDKFREFAIQSMTGSSGRQRVQAEALGRFGIVNPSPQVAQAFAQQSNALFTRICSVERQAKTLKAIRDTLLPKLMSGEIKVSEMEIFAEGMKL